MSTLRPLSISCLSSSTLTPISRLFAVGVSSLLFSVAALPDIAFSQDLIVVTTGNQQHGSNQFSGNNNYDTVDITTTGSQADGVRLQNWGPIFRANSLNIITTGYSSDAILMARDRDGGLVQINGPTIITTTDGMGVRAVSGQNGPNTGVIELNGSSTISTAGPGNSNSGYAVYAGVDLGGCGPFNIPLYDCRSVGAGEVLLLGGPDALHTLRTTGTNAHAVYALGRGHIELGNVDIQTEGNGAAGIVARRQQADDYLGGARAPQDFSGTVNLAGNVTIVTSGSNSLALHADSFDEANGADSEGVTAAIRSYDRTTGQVVTDGIYDITGNMLAERSGIIDLNMGDTSRFVGATTRETNGVLNLAIEGPASVWEMTADSSLSSLTLLSGAMLKPIPTGLTTSTLTGLTNNGGVIDLTTATPGNIFTIEGDYAGNNGLLRLSAALGGDASATDKLIVTGNTSGSTGVKVVNIGGTGAPTVEGIKIIEVLGTSAGAFSLLGDFEHGGEQAIIGGAYAYTLHQGGVAAPTDGAWYLRSELMNVDPGPGPVFQPAAPLFEAYPSALIGLLDMPTLKQRVGDYAVNEEIEAREARVRIRGNRTEWVPSSTTLYEGSQDTWGLDVGVDAPIYHNEHGVLVGGLTASYQQSVAQISSPYGSGNLDTMALGLGGSLTWYDNSGFYLDAQGRVLWMQSDINSATLGPIAIDNTAVGYALSLEGGYQFALTDELSVIPQAQVSVRSVAFDDITQATGLGPVTASLLDGTESELRLGVAVEHKSSWQASNGTTSSSTLYAIGNIYYAIDGQTAVSVDRTELTSQRSKLSAGVGLGGTLNLNDGATSLFGEVSFRTGLDSGFSDNEVRGKVGFRVAF